MNFLPKSLLVAGLFFSVGVLGSLPYPEFDMMPQPYGEYMQTPVVGWDPGDLPTGPRYEHEKLSESCQIPPGMYRYEMIPGQDYRTDMLVRKVMMKFHVNSGGMVIATLEIYPNKSSMSFQRLLGDEPRRELYLINSYTRVSDLNRCSGFDLRINADQVELYNNTLNGELYGHFEPGRQCLRVRGELVRRRSASGLISESNMRINLDNVCLQYRSR